MFSKYEPEGVPNANPLKMNSHKNSSESKIGKGSPRTLLLNSADKLLKSSRMALKSVGFWNIKSRSLASLGSSSKSPTVKFHTARRPIHRL